MMNKYNKNKAFTLIEVIVSITIFSIIIVSVIWIYIVSNDITTKADINRIMQENIKNINITISEDIRKNWILWVSSDALDLCDMDTWSNYYKDWDKLCTNSLKKYYLAKKNETLNQFIRVKSSECSDVRDHCYIVTWDNSPLTNDQVSVKKLNFSLSKDSIPKVTMNIVLVVWKWLWINRKLVEDSEIIFQTTISQRPF